jgi:hypothetical protein
MHDEVLKEKIGGVMQKVFRILNFLPLTSLAVISLIDLSPLTAATFTVTTANVDDATSGLRAAINAVNGGTADTIAFDPSLSGASLTWQTTTANLPPLFNSATIIGPSSPVTLDAQANNFRGLMVLSGTTSITNFNMTNLKARGGSGGSGVGGGGGLGAGGALFVHSGTTVTINTATFNNNEAIGGNGAASSTTTGSRGGGGGGGMGANGGNGGSPVEPGGGGGGGLFGHGGNSDASGSSGGRGWWGVIWNWRRIFYEQSPKRRRRRRWWNSWREWKCCYEFRGKWR